MYIVAYDISKTRERNSVIKVLSDYGERVQESVWICDMNAAEYAVNFHSKCKILGGVAEFFSKAFLCRFPPENFPRPVVYPVHSLPV